MHTIKIRHHFDAAHRLSNYIGKCSNIHGHSFMVDVEIESKGLTANDMVADFARIKGVINTLDHKILLNDCLKNGELIDLLDSKMSLASLTFDCEPTAENIAKYLHQCIKRHIKPSNQLLNPFDNLIKQKVKGMLPTKSQHNKYKPIVLKVTVWESPDCSASYSE